MSVDKEVTSASALNILTTVTAFLPKWHAKRKGWVCTASDHQDLKARDDISRKPDLSGSL